MTEKPDIRPMREGEEADWAALRSTLWPDCGQAENASDLAALRAANGALKIVLLAITDGRPIGFIEISCRNVSDVSVYQDSPHIEGWFVADGYRRQGIGTALIEAAADWARANGFAAIESDVELDNAASRRAHEKLGFAETGQVVTYSRRLDR